MGVVRQEVKTSAGNSALCGRVSCASQAASRMQSLEDAKAPEALSYQKQPKVTLAVWIKIIYSYLMATKSACKTNYSKDTF